MWLNFAAMFKSTKKNIHSMRPRTTWNKVVNISSVSHLEEGWTGTDRHCSQRPQKIKDTTEELIKTTPATRYTALTFVGPDQIRRGKLLDVTENVYLDCDGGYPETLELAHNLLPQEAKKLQDCRWWSGVCDCDRPKTKQVQLHVTEVQNEKLCKLTLEVQGQTGNKKEQEENMTASEMLSTIKHYYEFRILWKNGRFPKTSILLYNQWTVDDFYKKQNP